MARITVLRSGDWPCAKLGARELAPQALLVFQALPCNVLWKIGDPGSETWIYTTFVSISTQGNEGTVLLNVKRAQEVADDALHDVVIPILLSSVIGRMEFSKLGRDGKEGDEGKGMHLM